jgi:hypothetical protein
MSVCDRIGRGAVVLAACVLLAGVASAGVFDPPAWDDEPNTTRQQWSFPEQWGSDNGNLPDGGHWNPNGTPGGSADGATDDGRWQETLDGRDGLLVLSSGPLIGPPGPDTFVTFTVQNTEVIENRKDYWVRVIYKGSIRGEVSATVGGAYTDFQMLSEFRNLDNGWKERVFTGSLPECPPFENFKIFNTLATGNTYVDEVEIRTRCIPTPGGAVLVLLGLAAVPRHRR